MNRWICLVLVFCSVIFVGCERKEKKSDGAEGKPPNTGSANKADDLNKKIMKYGFTSQESEQISADIESLIEKSDEKDSWKSRTESAFKLAGRGNKIVPLIADLAKNSVDAREEKLYIMILMLINTPDAQNSMVELAGGGKLNDIPTDLLIKKAREMRIEENLPEINVVGYTIAKRGDADIKKLMDVFRIECQNFSFDNIHNFLAMKSVVAAVGSPAVPYLVEILKDEKSNFAHEDIIQMLGEIGDSAAESTLHEIVRNPSSNKGELAQAKWALNQIKQKAKVD